MAYLTSSHISCGVVQLYALGNTDTGVAWVGGYCGPSVLIDFNDWQETVRRAFAEYTEDCRSGYTAAHIMFSDNAHGYGIFWASKFREAGYPVVEIADSLNRNSGNKITTWIVSIDPKQRTVPTNENKA